MNRHSERSEKSVIFNQLEILHFVQDDSSALIAGLTIKIFNSKLEFVCIDKK